MQEWRNKVIAPYTLSLRPIPAVPPLLLRAPSGLRRLLPLATLIVVTSADAAGDRNRPQAIVQRRGYSLIGLVSRIAQVPSLGLRGHCQRETETHERRGQDWLVHVCPPKQPSRVNDHTPS